MEYSNGNTMTRKEYLNSKKKKNFWLSKIKYILLTIVIILLGIYVFKQLNVYNNVTKLANKVVEESKLARTMTMYYVAEPYIKDGAHSVVLYKSYDESRTEIAGTENLTNITVQGDKLYGLNDGELYSIDLLTNEKIQLAAKIEDKKIESYQINENDIYLRVSDGIYKRTVTDDKIKKIIDGKTYQMIADDKNVYVIMAGKTTKSIIKYSLNGKKQDELSDKYIVSGLMLAQDKVLFLNSKDNMLYSVLKTGSEIKKEVDDSIADIKNIVAYKDVIYYINKKDSNTLYMYNLNTKNIQRVVKKNIASIEIDGSVIYYMISGNIGVYKYDITTGKTAQITSARTSEYVCIN